MEGGEGGRPNGTGSKPDGNLSRNPAIVITAVNEMTRDSDGDSVRCDFASELAILPAIYDRIRPLELGGARLQGRREEASK